MKLEIWAKATQAGIDQVAEHDNLVLGLKDCFRTRVLVMPLHTGHRGVRFGAGNPSSMWVRLREA